MQNISLKRKVDKPVPEPLDFAPAAVEERACFASGRFEILRRHFRNLKEFGYSKSIRFRICALYESRVPNMRARNSKRRVYAAAPTTLQGQMQA